MPGKLDKQKSELIESLAGKVRERLTGKRGIGAAEFLRCFYAHVPPDDMVGESPDNLYGAALALWQLAQERKAGTAKIRVYNPRPDEQGWKSSHTVIEIINDDMPFLVDSVTAELNSQDAEVLLVVHPILMADRDAKGRLEAYRKAPAKGERKAAPGLVESVMHVQISEQPAERHEEIRLGLAKVLDDVRAAVADWAAMRQRLVELVAELEAGPPAGIPKEELAEGIAFLKWIAEDHFTFLGYRQFDFAGQGADAVAKVQGESGLGILRDETVSLFEGIRDLGKLPEEVRAFLKQPALLRVTKSNRRATVHRRVHLDTIAIKSFDKKGRVTGERQFAGLFTSVAYSRSPREIPLLRLKVQKVIALAGFAPGSHDGKALQHILETFPRDELFQIGVEELHDIALGVLNLQERQRIALFVRRDPFERFVSCLVYVPRDRYDTALRLRLQDLLTQAYGGEINAFYTHLTDEALARVQFIIKTTRGAIPEVDAAELESKLIEAGRSWSDRLEDELIESRGEEQGLAALRRFGKAFSAAYQERFNEQAAIYDISRIEKTLSTGRIAMNLYRPLEADEQEVRFKIYVQGAPVALSDILPMLENMGLKVISEIPYEVRPRGLEGSVWMHDFVMQSDNGGVIDIGAMRDNFHQAFAAIWRGEMENDGFNKLVLRAGLRARELTILRAYCKFLRQAKIPFGQAYMESTLAEQGGIARNLVRLFELRFDPDFTGDDAAREKGAEKLIAEIEAALAAVSSLDDDRIIRRFLNAIESTLRTNLYQSDAEGRHKGYISFKLDSRKLEELPLPRPFREIFVYSPRFEGVHLRFGKVARGGIRWSDRREDFRTEILGLVKAQQVKNAVIVPVGSKGGFVLKRPPPADAGREALLEEGIACYKLLLNGLLDITDNLKAGKLVPPTRVVRRDDDDPYLVVAADKGTATFSDIANGVSADYGFWLDDAFASGGSAGYDHKGMGITARGGWESVKRHFREIGKNIQEEEFTAIGVGDMSGDVFGNGMLLSKKIKLLGAFNHLHIFVDPDPDPEKTFAERKRLFELPRSGWNDYDTRLISKGGGVFERKAKAIKVSAEMKRLFAITRDQVTPAELIQSMLKAKVELLWFGGIGTYVKASDESQLEVGDRTNDALRVDADMLCCQVIGEGANLGVTQRGRVEFALNGGRLNTDSIDNSAGVDCSDHEVNIKILLRDVEESGDITRKQRDKLLEKMTDEVAELVLRDNYLQTQAISVTAQMSAHLLDRTVRFMKTLERVGQLDRAIEYLPDDETAADRFKLGLGLTRPELAVLLSYTKINLYDALLSSDLPDDPDLAEDLTRYFPTPLQKSYAAQIARHRLKREIVTTVVTNSIVNRVGITFVHEVQEKTGRSAADIARAFTIARQIFEMRRLFTEIEALDNKVPAALQYAMLVECGRLIERGAVWFLRASQDRLLIKREIETYGPGVATLADKLAGLLGDSDRANFESRGGDLARQGVPESLARHIAALPLLVPACDIVALARASGIAVEQAGRAYFTVGARFGLDWLRSIAGRLPSDNAWDKLAVGAIVDDLYGHQSELTARVLGNGEAAKKEVGVLIGTWAEGRPALVTRTEQLLTELKAAGTPDLAMLAVANRQIKSLVGS